MGFSHMNGTCDYKSSPNHASIPEVDSYFIGGLSYGIQEIHGPACSSIY